MIKELQDKSASFGVGTKIGLQAVEEVCLPNNLFRFNGQDQATSIEENIANEGTQNKNE